MNLLAENAPALKELLVLPRENHGYPQAIQSLEPRPQFLNRHNGAGTTIATT
jgi:hypothetical protein